MKADRRKSSWDSLGLAAALAGGFVLRILPIRWGIGLGRFEGFFHPDEPKMYSSVLLFPGNYLSNRNYIYGTAWQYLVGIALSPARAILRVAAAPAERAVYPVACILATRLSSVVAGVLAVYLIDRAGRRLFDRRTGTFAALFLAFALYPCLNSALCTLDVPMSFLLLANLLLCLRAFERKRTRDALAFGAATGLLLGTKVAGAFFLVIPAAMGLAAALESGGVPARAWRAGLAYAASAAVVYAASAPHTLLRLGEYLAFMRAQKADYLDAAQHSAWDALRACLSAASDCVGWPVLGAALVGALSLDRKDRPCKLGMVALVVAYGLFWRELLYARYVIFLAPVLCLFAARACSRAAQSASSLVRVAGVAAACMIALYGTVRCARGVALRFDDTRTQAARYLASSVPAGDTLGIGFTSERFGWGEHRWRYPVVDFRRVRVQSFLDRPDFIVISSYDFEPIERALQSPSLSPDLVWDPSRAKDWYLASPPTPRVFRLYDELLGGKSKDYALVATFKKDCAVPIGFPPPEIRVYRRRAG